jgi:hypothetical protein
MWLAGESNKKWHVESRKELNEQGTKGRPITSKNANATSVEHLVWRVAFIRTLFLKSNDMCVCCGCVVQFCSFDSGIG